MTCLSLCLSVCLSVCLSACLSVHLKGGNDRQHGYARRRREEAGAGDRGGHIWQVRFQIHAPTYMLCSLAIFRMDKGREGLLLHIRCAVLCCVTAVLCCVTAVLCGAVLYCTVLRRCLGLWQRWCARWQARGWAGWWRRHSQVCGVRRRRRRRRRVREAWQGDQQRSV